MKRRAPIVAAARRQAGLSLTEVLIAVVLIASALVPAMLALQTGVTGAAVHADLAAVEPRLAARMESVLGERFAALADAAAAAGDASVASDYSDPPGVQDRLLVFLAPYDTDDADGDGDPFSGAEPDVIWVRVELAGTPHAIATLRGRAP